MFESPAVKLYALVSTLAGLHLVLLAVWTGTLRDRRMTFVNQEDATRKKGTHAHDDHVDVLRVKRAHQNALENYVPFFAIGLAYALSGPSKTGAYAYFLTFLATRLLHSVFYMWGKQPFRTIMFTLGGLTLIGMGVHAIRMAF